MDHRCCNRPPGCCGPSAARGTKGRRQGSPEKTGRRWTGGKREGRELGGLSRSTVEGVATVEEFSELLEAEELDYLTQNTTSKAFALAQSDQPFYAPPIISPENKQTHTRKKSSE